MSLNRTALRLATVLALNNAQRTPYPTIAGPAVFDSRADPIEGWLDKERTPIVIVYTDEDDGKALSVNNGGPGFRRDVLLVIEIGVAAVEKDADGNAFLTAIVTDSEVESMLDQLEHQIRNALYGPGDLANAWRTLAKRTHAWNSKRWSDPANARLRFSERGIIAHIEIDDDPLPGVVLTATPGALPPALQAVANMADGTPAQPYIDSVIDLVTGSGLPTPRLLPQLEGVRFKEADLGGGKRPDGVADIDFTS